MAKMSSLRDSFDLPELDRSKWSPSGSNYKLVSPYGVQFTSGSRNQYTYLYSADEFTFYKSYAYIYYDMYMHWNGYFVFALYDPTSNKEEWGFKIRGYTTKWSGGVNSVSTPAASLKADGDPKWAINQWMDARIVITSGPGVGEVYTILSNSNNELQLDIDEWDTKPTNSSKFRIEAITLTMYSVNTAGTTKNLRSINWNPNSFKWLRLSDTPYADRMYYSTSSDGVTWNVRKWATGVKVSDTRKLKLKMYYAKVGTHSYTAPEYVTVRLVNTRKQLYRAGPGQYLYEDFKSMPAKTLTVNQQFGTLMQIV